MMVDSAQPGKGGGCTPTPFHSIYPAYSVPLKNGSFRICTVYCTLKHKQVNYSHPLALTEATLIIYGPFNDDIPLYCPPPVRGGRHRLWLGELLCNFVSFSGLYEDDFSCFLKLILVYVTLSCNNTYRYMIYSSDKIK
jgi:hypothetical protein